MASRSTPAIPNLGLLGTFPPPWGGIEVHIRGLADAFSADGAHVVVFNTRPREGTLETAYPVIDLPAGPRRVTRITTTILEHRLRVLHAHLAAREWRLLVPLLPLRALGVRLCCSFHSFHEVEDRWAEGALPRVVHRLDAVFASGAAVRDRLIERGVRPEAVRLLAPFVAPPSADPSLLPGDVRRFLADHSPTVTAGASLLYTLHGREVYGLDVLIRAFPAVVARHPRAGLVLHVTKTAEPERLAGLRQLIRSLGIEGSTLLLDGPIPEPAALWAAGDVFVRPSWDDGDSVAVRQALWAKIPTIASDAVPRPDGVVLFPTGDAAALAEKLLSLLDDPAPARARLAALATEDAASRLRQIYRALSEGG